MGFSGKYAVAAVMPVSLTTFAAPSGLFLLLFVPFSCHLTWLFMDSVGEIQGGQDGRSETRAIQLPADGCDQPDQCLILIQNSFRFFFSFFFFFSLKDLTGAAPMTRASYAESVFQRFPPRSRIHIYDLFL